MGAYPVWHDETELMNYIEKEAFAAATATTTFLGHFECKRCDRAFSSRSAREQHLEASAQHFICLANEQGGRRCSFDGVTVEELLDHYLAAHNLHSCRGCLQVFVDFHVYMDHLEREFACPECHRHHESENNVEQHMIIHRERNVGCWVCDKTFTSTSAMILHLEAGCSSGVNIFDVNQHAASFVPSWKFVDPAYRQELMQRVELAQMYPAEKPAPFTCPEASCHANFTSLSGLSQHVEFGKCPASLTEDVLASLMAWLAHKTTQTVCSQ